MYIHFQRILPMATFGMHKVAMGAAVDAAVDAAMGAAMGAAAGFAAYGGDPSGRQAAS